MLVVIDNQVSYSAIINNFIINRFGEHSCSKLLKSKTYVKISLHITSTNESGNRDMAAYMSVKMTYDIHLRKT